MQTIPVSEAGSNLLQLIETAAAAHEPMMILGRHHNAVLLSEEDWRGIQETLQLTAIPGLKESIRAGMQTPVSDCHKEPGW
jgi:PHD/YefM family antitoxin component YafN of YafNO toxin-antitoxin module